MKKFALSLIVSSLALAHANAANYLLSYWSFNNPDEPASTSGAGTLDVTEGSGTLSWSGQASNLVYFAGTVTNVVSGFDRGVALAIQNGTNGVNNGEHLEFGISMSGLQDLQMSFAVQRTSTGFTDIDVSWAVGAGSFTSIASFDDLPSSFGTTSEVPSAIRTIDFSSVNADVADESDVRIRMTFSGGNPSFATGNNRIDNVIFTVPEPSTALFGLMAALGFAVRRRRA